MYHTIARWSRYGLSAELRPRPRLTSAIVRPDSRLRDGEGHSLELGEVAGNGGPPASVPNGERQAVPVKPQRQNRQADNVDPRVSDQQYRVQPPAPVQAAVGAPADESHGKYEAPEVACDGA